MKRLFALALALTFGVTAFANSDIIPVVGALQKARLLQECKVAPHIGADWKAHCIGAASVSSIPVTNYTGNAITPTPTVYLGGSQLTAGTDFTYSYMNNTNAGLGTVKLTAAKVGYFGAQWVKFRILPVTIPDSAIANIADTNYTGSAICPEPTITVNGRTLTKGTDFDFSYEDNVASSTTSNALCIVSGKGNYTGVASKKFRIVAVP